jgi:RNase H-like domain found in reverse transcriptase/Reverse transcriptase (RNA-dependent DNA polymerase)
VRRLGSANTPEKQIRYRKTADTFKIRSTCYGHTCQQFLDSGAERELIGLKYARQHNLKCKRLTHKVRIFFMDNREGTPITHATWQKTTIHGTNGDRTFTIKYLIADIPEERVLGLSWLRYANPDIDWKQGSILWRPRETLVIRKARQRIIQSEIASNEAPEWVKKEIPEVLTPQSIDLPPHRPGLDYEVKLKEGYQPKREPNRAFSQEEKRGFAELAKQEVAAGRWRLSDSPQAVQMLWAAKAGGKKRPCHDYRPINKWIKDDAFPVPIIKSLMSDMAKCKFLTSLDLPKAYYSVRIKDKRSEDLLAFYCNDALYAPTVMQFGSKTAVAHFQRFITTILHDVIGPQCRVYLDNIIIGTMEEEEHDLVTRKVLEALRKYQLWVQPDKCEWKKSKVMFCGFMVGDGAIELDPEKLKAITEWQPPRDGGPQAKTRVREYTGFCNFYRDAVDRYSEIAKPLTDLTSKTVKWQWTAKEEASWQLLKTAILAAPVLAAYREELPIECHTDASDKAIAATVEQKFDCGHRQPIAFYSRKLNPAEKNYTVHDKELLAIVKTFHHFRHWFHGSPEPIKVWSDHKALQHFLTKTELTQRHARWAELLGEFRFHIQHVKGRENRAADALSRKYGATEGKEKWQLLKEENFSKE